MVPSLVYYDELLLRYKYFVCMSPFLSRIIGCNGNKEISYYQNVFIFEDDICLHLSGPIEKNCTYNKMSYVFN